MKQNKQYWTSSNASPTFVKDVLEHLNQSFRHQGVQLPVDAVTKNGKILDLVKCDDGDYDDEDEAFGSADDRDEHARALGALIEQRAQEAVELWDKKLWDKINSDGATSSSSGQQEADGLRGTTRPVITFDFEDAAAHGQFLHRLRTFHLLACWDYENEAYVDYGTERRVPGFEYMSFGRRWLRIVKHNDQPDTISAQLTPQQRQNYEDVETLFLNSAALELRETEKERVVEDGEDLVSLSRVQADAAGGEGGEIRAAAGNETELKLELRVTFPHWAV